MDGFANVALHAQVKICTDFLLGLPTKTAVVTGNHDVYCKPHGVSIDTTADGAWIRRLRGKSNIVAVDGDCIEVGGLIVGCLGWLQSPDWPVSPDIILAHAAPATSPCSAPDGSPLDLGDSELWGPLSEPTRGESRAVLSGHVHEPKRHWCRWQMDAKTTVLNTGCDLSAPMPQHWIVETESQTACWFNGHFTAPALTISLT
jgi:3',5'-cyclic AMP phosphodiesterase CpdA